MELAKSLLIIAALLLLGAWLGRKFPKVLAAVPVIGGSSAAT